MQETNKIYEAPELVEIEAVEKVTLGFPNEVCADNCCCTKTKGCPAFLS